MAQGQAIDAHRHPGLDKFMNAVKALLVDGAHPAAIGEMLSDVIRAYVDDGT